MVSDRVKLEMVYCFMYWLNPDCELDHNIVSALWKFSHRLKPIYGKYERNELERADHERIRQIIGSYDEYIKSQVRIT